MLVVGDDEVRSRFQRALSEKGWQVISAGTGAEARKMAARRGYQVAVVDNRLPDERGVEVINSVKSLGVSMVALIRDEDTMIRIAARRLGVDHFLRFPVNPLELVEHILDVPAEPIAVTTPDGDLLEIDLGLKKVRKGGREVQLTRTEYRLLCTLAERPGHVFERGELLRKVWDDGYVTERTKRTVNTHIQRLRANLGDDPGKPRLIEAVRGFGYRLRRGEETIDRVEEFEWDDANLEHIAEQPGVEPWEAEEAVLNRRRISVPAYNVRGEARRAVIGATLEGRILFVVFTRSSSARDGIRVISARDAEEKRKRQYKRRKRR